MPFYLGWAILPSGAGTGMPSLTAGMLSATAGMPGSELAVCQGWQEMFVCAGVLWTACTHRT